MAIPLHAWGSIVAGIVGYYVRCSANMLEGDVQVGYNGQKGLTSGTGGKLTPDEFPMSLDAWC